MHRRKLSKRQQRRLLDRTVLVASFMYPFTGIPQVLAVWTGDGKVSLVTWAAFLAFSFLFLLYGFVHKIMPLVIANALWLVVDAAVVLGAIL